MGRGRGKGKKQIAIAHNNRGSREDDKISVERRGRPHKSLKCETEEVAEDEKIEHKAEEEGDDSKKSSLNISAKIQSVGENRKKRKSTLEAGENEDWMKVVENVGGTKANTDGSSSTKAVGYRQNGSRRKNKPRRAAEVGVECW